MALNIALYVTEPVNVGQISLNMLHKPILVAIRLDGVLIHSKALGLIRAEMLVPHLKRGVEELSATRESLIQAMPELSRSSFQEVEAYLKRLLILCEKYPHAELDTAVTGSESANAHV